MPGDDLRARIEAQKAARRAGADSSLHRRADDPADPVPSSPVPASSASAPLPAAPPVPDRSPSPVGPSVGGGGPTSAADDSPRRGRHSRTDHEAVTAADPQATAAPSAVTTVASAVPVYRPESGDSAGPAAPPTAPPRSFADLLPGRRSVISLLVLVVIVVVATITMRTYVVGSYWIPSASMEPTLHGCDGCNDDHVLVNKLSYRLHGFHRGDVIVFSRPPSVDTNENVLIKRIIGLPGDVLTEKHGTIYVNGLALNEPYINPACHGTEPPLARAVLVPAKTLFVMGDNRCDSTDSRRFGPIPESTVVGRAFLIVWPTGRWHWI